LRQYSHLGLYIQYQHNTTTTYEVKAVINVRGRPTRTLDCYKRRSILISPAATVF